MDHERDQPTAGMPAESPRSADSAWLAPGDLPVQLGDYIGHYHLLEVLGRGGFGIVYLAEQVEPVRRRVALKMILLGMDTEAVVARFAAEEQALAMMEHPHVARVFDAGMSASGRPYFVMELVHGVPITEHCDRHKLDVEERMELFLQVCDAIQHAHHKGVIHRDIKPSNVLVALADGQPSVKVIDFGVAKAVSHRLTGETIFTAQGQIIGTPEYMSPEQAEATAQDVDTRTDLYSLGVLLYELLTGSLPFDPKSLRAAGLLEIHRIIREVEPPKPSTRLSGLGVDSNESAHNRRAADMRTLERQLRGDLDWITMKAMEKDRNRRYDAVSGLADDIRRHLRCEPVVAGAPSAGYRISKFVKRNRTGVIAAMLIALTLVLGIIGTTTAAIRASRAQKLEEQERTRADRKAAEAERVAYLASVTAASESIRAAELGAASDRLEAAPAIHRNWEWDHLCSKRDESLAIVSTRPAAVLALAVSPDGALLAAAGNEGFVHLWDTRTLAEVRRLTAHDQPVSSLSFSGDGARLVSGSSDFTARVWRVEDGEHVATLGGTHDRILAVALSPDGRSLALSGRDDSTIQVYDIEKKASIARLTAHAGFVAALVFSPDGRWLASGASGNGEDTVRLWNTATWRQADSFAGHSGGIIGLAFTPDGTTLASGSEDQSIRLWDVRTGAALDTLEARDGAVHSVAFSPDGTRLAAGANGRRLHVWDVPNRRKLTSLVGHRDVIYATQFDGSGDRIFSASGDGTIRQWDGAWANFGGTFPEHGGAVPGAAFLGDGQTFLTVSTDRNARVWDADRGTLIHSIAAPQVLLSCASTRDGRLIATGDGKGTVRTTGAGLEQWQDEWPSGHGAVFALAFSADDTLLAAGHFDGTVVIRDAATGEIRGEHATHQGVIEDLTFAVSRPHVASVARDGTVVIWDAALGTLVRTIDGPGGWLQSVAFSPDDVFLAAGGRGNTITLYNAMTGASTATMHGHNSFVTALAYTPDGTRLLSGAYDRTVRVWDTRTHEEVLIMRGHSAEVLTLAMSPDGTRALSGGVDMSARLWDTVPRRDRVQALTTRPQTLPSSR